MRAMARTIVHDHQMFTRHIPQFPYDRISVQVSPLPFGFDLGASRYGGETKYQHSNTNQRNRPGQCITNRPIAPSEQTQVPNALYEQEIEQPNSRSEVVSERPGLY